MAANKVRRALQEKRDAIREFLPSLPLKFVFGRESRSYLFNMLILAQAFLLISVLYIFDKAYAYNASFFFFCFCSIFLFFFAHVDYARMRPFSIEYFLCVGRPQLADLRPIIGDMLCDENPPDVLLPYEKRRNMRENYEAYELQISFTNVILCKVLKGKKFSASKFLLFGMLW